VPACTSHVSNAVVPRNAFLCETRDILVTETWNTPGNPATGLRVARLATECLDGLSYFSLDHYGKEAFLPAALFLDRVTLRSLTTQPELDEQKLRQKYRSRVAIFAFCAILTVIVLGTIYDAILTLTRLEAVERGRDQWQRPSDVIQELNLEDGSIVADLGSGAGYFALKLSVKVGRSGRVLAVDILKYPLFVLRTRAFIVHQLNISTILGDSDDPHLPVGAVDAVLIANTYHELTAPKAILARLHRLLKRGGRLVILDHAARFGGGNSRQSEAARHEITRVEVEAELLGAGFEILKRDDHFVDRTGEDHVWWLITACKP
jgi:ubiquinone/menaquinone biosynthesis C-methylase UbiE